MRFFWVGHFGFFFFWKKLKNFGLIPWKAVKGSWIARMGRNFDDYPYPGFQPFRSWANTYAQDCSTGILTVILVFFLQKCDILSPLPSEVVNKYKVCIDKGTYDAISLSKVLTIVTSVMESQALVKYYVWFLKQQDWKTFSVLITVFPRIVSALE